MPDLEHTEEAQEAVEAMHHWLLFREGRLDPNESPLGDLWIAGVPGRGMPRGIALVEQLEAVMLLSWRRLGKGRSWANMVAAVYVEATRRIDLDVIAAAGLGAELVIPASCHDRNLFTRFRRCAVIT